MEMTKLEAERMAEDLSPVETRMILRALMKEMSVEDIARVIHEEMLPMSKIQLMSQLRQQ